VGVGVGGLVVGTAVGGLVGAAVGRAEGVGVETTAVAVIWQEVLP